MDPEILADVKQEGESDPFAGLNSETDTPADSPTVAKPEEVKPNQGDNTDPDANLPFHQHPRWKEREQKLKELEAFREEVLPQLEELRKGKAEPSTVEIAPWFRDLYGDDPAVWQRYQANQKEFKEQVKRELREDQAREQQEAAQENARWTGWVEEQIQGLTAEGFDLKDKDELINLMLKYRPTDENDNLDFKAGFELLKMSHERQEIAEQKKVEAKKRVASLTTDKPKGDGQTKGYLTNRELRGKGFRSII